MSHSSNDVDENLPDLINILERIMKSPANSMDHQAYLRLYTSIHNFCMSIEPGETRSGNQPGRGRHSHVREEKLYRWLSGFLKHHLQAVHENIQAQPSDTVLALYVEQWKQYTAAATFNKHLFRFLDRHWVARVLDEGKDTEGVHNIYSLHLIRWKEAVLDNGRNSVMSSLRQQIKERKDCGDVESLDVQVAIESFESVGVHNTDGTECNAPHVE